MRTWEEVEDPWDVQLDEEEPGSIFDTPEPVQEERRLLRARERRNRRRAEERRAKRRLARAELGVPEPEPPPEF